MLSEDEIGAGYVMVYRDFIYMSVKHSTSTSTLMRLESSWQTDVYVSCSSEDTNFKVEITC